MVNISINLPIDLLNKTMNCSPYFACWTKAMERSSPCAFYPRYFPPSHRTRFYEWHPVVHECRPLELNRAFQRSHGCHDTSMKISKWKNRTADGMTACPLQYLQSVQTEIEIIIWSQFVGVCHVDVVVKLQKRLTECVAKICKFGFASSISFWIIRRKDSTNKFNVCAWQAISNRSIASMAISTNLYRKRQNKN